MHLTNDIVEHIVNSTDDHDLAERLTGNKVGKDSSPFFVPGMSDYILLRWKHEAGDARGIAIQLGFPADEITELSQWRDGLRKGEFRGYEKADQAQTKICLYQFTLWKGLEDSWKNKEVNP